MANKANSEVLRLRQRVSALSDRMLLLENDLKRTQERMKEDMGRLVEVLRERKTK